MTDSSLTNKSTNDFNLLIQSNTREDDYVNATKLCKHFGKRYSEFKRLPSTKTFLTSLSNKCKNPTYSKKGVGTWVHPLVAIKLAEWLDSDFEVFVKQTFKAFLDADVKLAESIVERTDDLEGIKRLSTKAKGREKQLKAYWGLHDELKEHNAEGVHHAVINKHNNNLANISSRKSGISEDQAKVLTVLETIEELKLKATETRNAWQAVKVCKQAGNEGKQFLLAQGLGV